MHWHITLVGRLRIHAVFAECRAGESPSRREPGIPALIAREVAMRCAIYGFRRAPRDLQERHARDIGEKQMPIYTWDHIHLRSPDPEATAQWFERTLGAEIIRSMQQGKPRIDLKLGGANI